MNRADERREKIGRRGRKTKKEKGVKEKGIRDTERTLQESKGE